MEESIRIHCPIGNGQMGGFCVNTGRMETHKRQPPSLDTFEAGLKGLLRTTGSRVVAFAASRVAPGWSKEWGNWTVAPRPLFWRVYWNDRPMRLRFSDGSVDLPAKTIGVIPLLEGFLPEVDAETNHAYLHFELPDLPAGYLWDLFPKPLVLPNEQEMAHHMATLSEHAHACQAATADVPFRAQAVASLAFAAAARTLSPTSHKRLLDAMRGENPISPALTRMRDGSADPASLDELSRLCGMSRRAFTEHFRIWTGRSPLQYHLHLRLERAAELLMDSDEPIDAVAARTGFSDRYHLSKAFRKRHGQSPAAFRRRLQARRMRPQS